MNDFLTELEEILFTYRNELVECERKQKITDGLFGIGHSIKDDPCHDRFDAQLKALIERTAEAAPSSETAAQFIRTVYTQTDVYDYPLSAQWMLYAAERHLPKLVPFLSPVHAETLANEYGKRYRPWNRLPSQKALYKALKERAREKQ